MSRFLLGAPASLAMIPVLALTAALPALAQADLSPESGGSELHALPRSPGIDSFGLDGPKSGLVPDMGKVPRSPGRSAPKADERPEEAKIPTRAEMLDSLFDRLAKSSDPVEAAGVAGLIERMWMRSGSDTADLLMTRVVAAMGSDQRDIAEALLDKIVDLAPDWAEAWNKRATLRFLQNDDAGSMEDLSHALALEPRHFGALSGLGFILQRNGQDAGALKALRKALAIYPENEDLRKAVDHLTPEVEGRDL